MQVDRRCGPELATIVLWTIQPYLFRRIFLRTNRVDFRTRFIKTRFEYTVECTVSRDESLPAMNRYTLIQQQTTETYENGSYKDR